MSSILTAFVASLEATVNVLLTVFYGTLAGYLGLVNNKSSLDLSSLCVKLFMPCLLFVNVGSSLSPETIGRYAPIIILALLYNITAIILGSIATRIFKLPLWVTAAVTFNNSTSLPILLLQSFAVSGALSSISSGDKDSAMHRAASYFLINATISNSLTFTLGPRLIQPNVKEDSADNEPNADVESAESSENDSFIEDGAENIPLIPRGTPRPSWVKSTTNFLYQFWNAPFIAILAAVTLLTCYVPSGAFVGLIPALHDQFFLKDGIFRAWLTVSLENIGHLFASTQVIIVGVKLYATHVKMREGQNSGSLPLYPTLCVLLTRFIIMPAISIPVVYVLATKTQLLSNDPILWFSMMMMPVGPSAMRLTALADVSKADEKEKNAVAKFLALSYMVTPMVSFSAVASLKACEMILTERK
ncbi:hypothetical protein BDP27DRAFT_1214731 [Rhodocollybia butyracea]|uniref:Auxin efflux carrier n=1 Tax=Rhodocollybia butyracea TaxID=206335 RepID=A0A9P5UCM6_9AGAR|nr:hypothetical protein BDP27DRAFT_1217474 [Rhodocollybia butyracea]KAF9074297.1 hypothetical protein BDP27DRAFT_1214731 [Rhodocollybia butyracea]